MAAPLVLIIVFLLLTAAFSRQITGTGQWANPILALSLPHALLLVAYLLAFRNGILSFELGSKATLLLAAGYFAFVLGVIAIALPYARKRKLAVMNPRELRLADKLTRLSVFILFVAVAVKYLIIVKNYGNPVANIIAIRLDYVAGVLDYSFANSVAFVMSSFLMLNLGILMGAGVENRRYLLIFSLILIILNDVTIGGANWTFSNLCLFLCAWGVTKERLVGLKISWKGVQRGSIVVGAATTLVFALLAFRTEGSVGSEVSFSDVLLYYAGGDIATFGYFLEYPFPSILPGSYTFGGLYGLLDPLFSLFGRPLMSRFDPELFVADIGVRFNTSIHLSYYYSDFGEAGVVILSLVLGLLGMWAMVQYRQRFTLIRVQYFALLLFVIVMSIRGVPTEGKYFWILLMILPLLRRISYFVPFKSSPLVTATNQ